MSSYQYRKSHCGDKTVVRSSYLHNGISYTGKMTSLYWIRGLDSRRSILVNIPWCAGTKPVSPQCWWHRVDTGLVLSHYGMVTWFRWLIFLLFTCWIVYTKYILWMISLLIIDSLQVCTPNTGKCRSNSKNIIFKCFIIFSTGSFSHKIEMCPLWYY